MDIEMTPPISFTREENAILLAAVSSAVLQLEQAEGRVGILNPGRAHQVLSSLRTLFTENGYAFERKT